ncbi:hypothetical protein [Lewinella sp. IMCC34183]|uniref:hypothetical protein n=1 Tax=Lewinella sp. IMCC34183 TaxID=2248762 RepID=UPI000E27A69D|nr:hypothetical protein [Lewinella sp. IMCC34183]
MRYAFLLLFALFLSTSLLRAQTREDDARDDLNYGNAKRAVEGTGGDIWYGAGATIGFSASNYSSNFRIGVSPMVGYKFNNIFSAGPRVSLIYNRFTLEPDLKDNSFTWSAGVFTRAKIYRGFFAHAEYSLVSEKTFGYLTNSQGNVSLEVLRRTRPILFLGGGISQGGGPGAGGFEFLVLFRMISEKYLNDAPYEIRSGFNYNF